MELARRIRQTDAQVPILFLTAMKEYVFEGYEVKALRYLIKPVQEEALFAILDEIQSADQRFVLLNGSRINLNDLVYVEAEAHYCHFVFEDHRQKEKIGIRELKAMIDTEGLCVDIQVDGGIYTHNVEEVIEAGANVIVAGSAIFKGDTANNTKEMLEILKRYE